MVLYLIPQVQLGQLSPLADMSKLLARLKDRTAA